MTSAPKRALAGGLALALVLPALPAAAIEKDQCIAAYEATQKLRKEGKLGAAQEKALFCAQDGCPAMVRDDCTSWATEIDKNEPSVMLIVTDGSGKELVDVKVEVDGVVVRQRLDGKALPLDPGSHTLRFSAEGLPSVDQTVVAHEGEKNKSVTVKLAAPSSATTSAERPTPSTVYVFTAVGAVGVLGFGVFGLMGNSKKSELDACKPNCASSDVDAVKSKYRLADISLGVGVVSLGTALVLYLTRGDSTPAATTTDVSFDVRPVVGGGLGSFAVTF